MNKQRKINEVEIFALIEYVSSQRNMTIEEVSTIMRDALIKSFAINFDPDANLEIIIDNKNKKFDIVNHTTYVVEDETPIDSSNEMIEIKLKDAKKINSNAKVGDVVSTKIEFSKFSNEIANQIGQLFKQDLVKKHKSQIYDKYKSLKGEIVDAEVVSVRPQQVIFKLESGIEASMPNFMRNNRQPLSPGQKSEVYVEDVKEMGAGHQIIVSNGSTEIVKRFLEREIPEIEEGLIEVIAISRIPGFKTKIAIKSNNPNIDPSGSVIGPRGSRINAVSEHLYGERIDVIRWDGDINKFVANSISPAKAIAVIDKNKEETIGGKIIVVPNIQQTLAIGKGGTNIKLASHLTKEKLDVISLSQAKEEGVNFEWNGNISPEEVEMVEAGNKLHHFNRTHAKNDPYDSISSFDHDISSFTENIVELDSSKDISKENINYGSSKSRKKTKNDSYDKSTNFVKNAQKNKIPTNTSLQNEEEEFENTEFNYDDANSISDEELKRMEEEFGLGDFDLSDFKDKK